MSNNGQEQGEIRHHYELSDDMAVMLKSAGRLAVSHETEADASHEDIIESLYGNQDHMGG